MRSINWVLVDVYCSADDRVYAAVGVAQYYEIKVSRSLFPASRPLTDGVNAWL